MTREPVKDRQTVTSAGQPVERLLEGVVLRPARPIPDKRGDVIEILDPRWADACGPLVYAYQVSLRPHAVKGWVRHLGQEDRIFLVRGALRWALFDSREGSPTAGELNLITVTERNPSLLVIPRGVFHAVENLGLDEAVFINLPTAPFNHEDPDKYRLPLVNDLIPFAFDDGRGW
jgi:dTDP-4-dehydrorhamnose 3,5-epimerase